MWGKVSLQLAQVVSRERRGGWRCHSFEMCECPLDDKVFGYLMRVIVTPAVYPRLVEFLHFDIQSTGQKSHCVNTLSGLRNALF